MDKIILEALTNWGAAGIVALVMWKIAFRFMNLSEKQHGELVLQLTARIDALENSSKACEEDRRQIHKNLLDIVSNRKSAATIRKSLTKAKRSR